MCASAFRAQIGQIDVAIFQARHWHDFESGHDRARRVRAVGGSRDEADVAMRFAARRVVLADREQSGVFALRAGVRLERDRRKAGDLGKPIPELIAHLAVTDSLLIG